MVKGVMLSGEYVHPWCASAGVSAMHDKSSQFIPALVQSSASQWSLKMNMHLLGFSTDCRRIYPACSHLQGLISSAANAGGGGAALFVRPPPPV